MQPPDDRDSAHLWDMLVHAREVLDTAGVVSFEEYLENKTLRMATERRIEIIGEAARNVSREFQSSHDEIPWQKIVAMRHILAHEYGEIKQEIIYRVSTVRMKELVDALVPLVPQEGSTG